MVLCGSRLRDFLGVYKSMARIYIYFTGRPVIHGLVFLVTCSVSFLQGTRKTRPCLSGGVVHDYSFFTPTVDDYQSLTFSKGIL